MKRIFYSIIILFIIALFLAPNIFAESPVAVSCFDQPLVFLKGSIPNAKTGVSINAVKFDLRSGTYSEVKQYGELGCAVKFVLLNASNYEEYICNKIEGDEFGVTCKGDSYSIYIGQGLGRDYIMLENIKSKIIGGDLEEASFEAFVSKLKLNQSQELQFNSPTLNIYTPSMADSDPDNDGFIGANDACPNTSFSIYVMNKNTKKKPASISLPDSNISGPHYPIQYSFMLKKITKTHVLFEVTSNSSPILKIATTPSSVTDVLDKKMKVLYANKAKGFAVISLANGGPYKEPGCGTGDVVPGDAVENRFGL